MKNSGNSGELLPSQNVLDATEPYILKWLILYVNFKSIQLKTVYSQYPQVYKN